MKKLLYIFMVVFTFVLIIFAIAAHNNNAKQNTLMRVHIRANSNLAADQNVKYAVKDDIVGYLTPLLKDCTSKQAAQQIINDSLDSIVDVATRTLRRHGFDYGARAEVNNEYFPSRAYEDIVVEGGYYDALIIFLGEGTGDNWWCVVYPPLCFLGEGEGNIEYVSYLKELISKRKK